MFLLSRLYIRDARSRVFSAAILTTGTSGLSVVRHHSEPSQHGVQIEHTTRHAFATDWVDHAST
jgi:hypothetical protein